MLAEWLETLDDDAREYFEERAAILEFLGRAAARGLVPRISALEFVE